MMVKAEWSFNQKLRQSPAWLHFSDGTKFEGRVNIAPQDARLKSGIIGEAAFTTGMSGYEETATDPSFLGQHIIYTNAHVGNYPANPKVRQSKKCHASLLIARHFSYNRFLDSVDVPLFSCQDTRELVHYLITHKNHVSILTGSPEAPAAKEFDEKRLVCSRLELVSQTDAEVVTPGPNPIVVVNYGIKQAIIDHLKAMGKPLVTLPYNSTAETVLSYKPQLVFLSNGPGDPRDYSAQAQEVKKLLSAGVPVRGICLGHQLLTLALGAKIVKLPFGQRGINHPVMDHESGNILITSQNHGYATEDESFEAIRKKNTTGKEVVITHSSLFDQSIEGLATVDGLVRSVQFHPEAAPGPTDAFVFFSEIRDYLEGKKRAINPSLSQKRVKLTGLPKKDIPYKKILLIGSGPIKIGQASEFDYSGTQACKALKSLGLEVVLLNSNPATIMTDPEMAARTYVEPITADTVKKIVAKEKVDAVLSTLGGQTALNLCLELDAEGFLAEKGIELLGAKPETIRLTEDRELFAREMQKLGYQAGKRFQGKSPEDALVMAREYVGFPLIIRRDFALGGRGAALCYSEEELREILYHPDLKYPVTMEKSLVGQKEIELEVMVDKNKNGVIICSIENVDPCGIHTGDSITVAPAQTISDRCYQQLRTMTLTIARHMGVVAGGANVQFAINPDDENDITVIEMNPRVSRSSALASKATGYPIAKISALLAVGYTLPEILNDITKASPVSFEPSLDYVAVKIPIFPFNKFPTSSTTLGPQMRSVGEVLALGGSFNEAFLKALRSLELGLEIPTLSHLKTSPLVLDRAYLIDRLTSPKELSLVTVMDALRAGISEEEIYRLSRISEWFIVQAGQLVEAEKWLKENPESLQATEHLFHYKALGFSDKHLALLTNQPQREVFRQRLEKKIRPVFKAVDTCSGEFLAQTPYFYSTYNRHSEAAAFSAQGKKAVVVMGSGPNRIGQGIEFDYSCVKACAYLQKKSIKAIMVNSNPETVSTDYDSSDRLYLAPLYSEDLFDIFDHENAMGIIACFSGQTGIKIRKHLEGEFRSEFKKFPFMGPTLETIDLTEDRKLFDEVTRGTGLSHTRSQEVTGHKKLLNAMVEIGPPVIIRPSYVIGGESMYIFYSPDDLLTLPPILQDQLKHSGTTFQVENYLRDAIEYDVDLVRDQEGHCVFTVCEHIEHAGVHSGDSGMVTPPTALTPKLYQQMKEISKALAAKLKVLGPINFQYAVLDEKIYCIEANPRGSRTLPFLSKAFHLDLAGLATEAMLGGQIPDWDREYSDVFCVKQSTFPFDRFVQDNIILGPKMRSTGETMGIDEDKDKAILKSYLGNYPSIDRPGKILISLSENGKSVILPYLKNLRELGYSFYATYGTYHFIRKQGIPCEKVAKIHETDGLSMLDVLKDPDLRMVFNTPLNQGQSKSDGERIRNMAIQLAVPCFTRRENIRAVIEAILGTYLTRTPGLVPLSLQETRR